MKHAPEAFAFQSNSLCETSHSRNTSKHLFFRMFPVSSYQDAVSYWARHKKIQVLTWHMPEVQNPINLSDRSPIIFVPYGRLSISHSSFESSRSLSSALPCNPQIPYLHFGCEAGQKRDSPTFEPSPFANVFVRRTNASHPVMDKENATQRIANIAAKKWGRPKMRKWGLNVDILLKHVIII